MKKKLIPAISILVITVICICLVVVVYPTPKYQVTDPGSPIVMTVDGDEVHTKEYASMMVYSRAYMDNMMNMYGMSTEMWDDPAYSQELFSQLREQTKNQVVYIHTIINQFEKAKLKLARYEINQMKEQKEQVIEQQGGEAMFNIWLATLGLDEEMYDNILLVSNYAQKLENYYLGDHGKAYPPEDHMLSYFQDHYIQAKHILISTRDDMNLPLTGDALQEKTKLAEDVLAKVEAGEDFDALIKEFNEDPGMSQSPDGYIFTEGDMVEEFYEAAKALANGETSDIVKSDFGYHIIKRVPLDESKMNDYAPAIASGLTGKDVSFSSMIEEWMSAAQVETTDEFEKITLDNVLSYVLPAEDGDSHSTQTSGADGGASAQP